MPTGRPRGRPMKLEEELHRFVLRVLAPLYARLTHLSETSDASVNDVILLALRKWMARPPKRTPAGIRTLLGDGQSKRPSSRAK